MKHTDFELKLLKILNGGYTEKETLKKIKELFIYIIPEERKGDTDEWDDGFNTCIDHISSWLEGGV